MFHRKSKPQPAAKDTESFQQLGLIIVKTLSGNAVAIQEMGATLSTLAVNLQDPLPSAEELRGKLELAANTLTENAVQMAGFAHLLEIALKGGK